MISAIAAPKCGTALCRGERRQIHVREKRDDRNIAALNDVLHRRGERVTQFGVFRISHIEAALYQLVQQILGHFPVDRMIEFTSTELRNGTVPGNDGERGIAAQRERLHVIASEKDDDIRFGLVEESAQLIHRGNAGIQLLRFLIGRSRHQLGRVRGREGRNNFTHCLAPFRLQRSGHQAREAWP
jgi:hypothetical protein